MSIVGGFFNAKNVNGLYDRVYNAEDFAAYFANFISSGVFAQPSNQMKVVPGGGLSVDVSVGKGYIKGYWVDVPQTHHLTVSPNMTGQTEQIKVVCKIDFGNRVPVLEVQENVESLLPENDYELVLATFSLQVGESEITAAMITDRRPDESYCGFVTGLVDQIDFTELMSQQQAQFNDWFDAMKGQLSEDAAGNLQQQIDSIVIPAKTSELINNGGSRKEGNSYYVKRGYYKWAEYDYGYGPDELYYNSRRHHGVVNSLDTSIKTPKTWCSGINFKSDGSIDYYVDPSWAKDWRAYSENTRGQYDERKLTNGVEIYLRADEGMFCVIEISVRNTQNKLGMSGSHILVVPMGWIFLQTTHPYDLSNDVKASCLLTENFDIYTKDTATTYKKVVSVALTYQFLRTVDVNESTQYRMPWYKIRVNEISMNWQTGYASGYEMYIKAVYDIGSNQFSV